MTTFSDHPVIQRLIGCWWGRTISTLEDKEPCPERAVRITQLHNGPEQLDVRLCQRHTELLDSLTDPHHPPAEEPSHDRVDSSGPSVDRAEPEP